MDDYKLNNIDERIDRLYDMLGLVGRKVKIRRTYRTGRVVYIDAWSELAYVVVDGLEKPEAVPYRLLDIITE